MLFVTYWELNENVSIEKRFEAVSKAANSGLFPPPNVNILRWDETPDGWGILVMEAEKTADVAKALNLWRIAFDGFFKETKTAPAMPVEDAMPAMAEFLQSWGSA